MPYLDLAAFRDLTLMPSGDVDALETVHAGWIDAQLAYWSAQLDSRLRKRYDAPFSSPYPIAVTGWLARIVTVRCYLKRGVDPNDEQYTSIKEDADAAIAEVLEAAKADEGLFDLPLRADTTATGISKGTPLAYTEASPYVWADVQADAAHDEDRDRRGTST